MTTLNKLSGLEKVLKKDNKVMYVKEVHKLDKGRLIFYSKSGTIEVTPTTIKTYIMGVSFDTIKMKDYNIYLAGRSTPTITQSLKNILIADKVYPFEVLEYNLSDDSLRVIKTDYTVGKEVEKVLFVAEKEYNNVVVNVYSKLPKRYFKY